MMMNHYESEYQKQKQQKSASFKKIEDEYSAMKAALLSSMDSEEDLSDEDAFPNSDLSLKRCVDSVPRTVSSDPPNPLQSLSGQPKTIPSTVKSSRSSLEESVLLKNAHGKDHQLVLDSKHKLGSISTDAADNLHEDVLVRNSPGSVDTAAVMTQGRREHGLVAGCCYPVALLIF